MSDTKEDIASSKIYDELRKVLNDMNVTDFWNLFIEQIQDDYTRDEAINYLVTEHYYELLRDFEI